MQMASPQPIEAYGLVLDPVTLVSDAGRMDSTQAAAAAAAADVARLDGLYRNNADASLKALQASRSQAAEAAAQAQSAASHLQVAVGAGGGTGRRASQRADRGTGCRPAPAGARRRARSPAAGRDCATRAGDRRRHQHRGASARTVAAHRSRNRRAPAGCCRSTTGREGLGPGARARVQLQAASVGRRAGAGRGAALWRARAPTFTARSAAADDKAQYAAAPVKLLGRVGDGWLVEGLGRSDSIVVQGAGVLWSLEGISTFSAAEEEHD